MTFEGQFDVYKTKIEERLSALIRFERPETLCAAMRYSALGGGKRLRGALLLAACEACGGSVDNALDFAVALEMIHAYSLVHDDLPAMDDDDFRRGQPSCHKVYGEAVAILAGDGLLNLAYETMVNACLRHDSGGALHAMAAIAHSAGAQGMVGGQVLDMAATHKTIDNDTLLTIYNKKTGALFMAALTAGGLLADCRPEMMRFLTEVSARIGLAFQIKDDILEQTVTGAELGKSTNSDAKNAKSTYVTVNGLAKAQADYAKLYAETKDLLAQWGNPFMAALTDRLFERKM